MNKKYIFWFRRTLPYLLSLVLVIAIYYPVFFKGYFAVNRSDALNIHVPINYMVAQGLLKGKISFWNPYVNLGQPTVDGSTTVFHPGILLYLFFNPWLANTIEIITGLFLTCLGAWQFLKQQGFKMLSASIGMILYVFSGPVFFLHSYHLGFMAILLLPWSLWVFHKHDRSANPKWLWLAASLGIIAAQSMDFDTLIYLYAGLLIDRIVCIPLAGRRRYLVQWTLILLLSFLTGALLYLPFYEWLVHSSRIIKSYRGILDPGPMNMLVALITNQWLTFWPYDVFYFYIGPACIWLVFSAVIKFDKKTYAVRYFLFSGIIPLYYFVTRLLQYYHIGMWSVVDSWRSMFVFCFGLSMVACIGAENILKEKRIIQRVTFISGLVVMFFGGWEILSGFYPAKKYVFLLIAAGAILMVSVSWAKKYTSLRAIGILAAVLAVTVIPSMNYVTEKYLGILSRNSISIKNLGHYKTVATAARDRGGDGRVAIFGESDNTTVLLGLKTVPNYTSIYNKEFESALVSDSLITSNYQLPYWMQLNNPNAHSLSLYGVEFLVALDSIAPREDNQGWFERKDLSWPYHVVLENRRYLGRAYIVTAAGEYKRGVDFLEDAPESVVLKVFAEEGDRLVLADLSYPGWRVLIDSKNVASENYHGCLRSVILAKGMHIVRWYYDGQIQMVGLRISLVALILLVLLLIRETLIQINFLDP